MTITLNPSPEGAVAAIEFAIWVVTALTILTGILLWPGRPKKHHRPHHHH